MIKQTQSLRIRSVMIRFDVSRLLETKVGEDWQDQIAQKIADEGVFIPRTADHATVREADPIVEFGLTTLEGGALAEAAPGLWELYRTTFKQMMQIALPPGMEPLRAYEDPSHALEAVSQQPAEGNQMLQHRMEAHVDQRYTAVLVVKRPKHDDEGRLVIANNPDSLNVEEIEKDATRIVHESATLVCFSRGRVFPHFTEEIYDPESARITVGMNYPTESETPEAAQELLDHSLGRQ